MTSDNYKLLSIDSPSARKTTCIAALSDILPLSTDVIFSGELARIKEKTTGAMDYGEMYLDDGVRLLLYGLPGQLGCRFMFEIVSDGLVGINILADAANRNCVTYLDTILREYADQLRIIPCILAINKSSDATLRVQAECAELLRLYDLIAPLCIIAARRPSDIIKMFDLLCFILEAAQEDKWAFCDD